MRILFLHNNFPAQFGALGQYLAQEGWQVTFLTQRKGSEAAGIDVIVYRDRDPKPEHAVNHPYLRGAGSALTTGLSALEVCAHLKEKRGYTPDVIVAHSGWGPGLFMKDVWPDTPLINYFEWYYRGDAVDVTYLNGPDRPAFENARERIRNAVINSDLLGCDAGLCPTRFQAAQFPAPFRDKLHVMHDGVDTVSHQPGDPGPVTFDGVTFERGDEIVTYVARGMEPYRGFPAFMEALARVQKTRPELKAIIVGEDRCAYGKPLPSGKTYKQDCLDRLDLDTSRIAFTGLLPRGEYRKVLQLSSVHVYLTVPFVLSWSMLEAMSTGCLILGSDTDPVREVVVDGENGLLTDPTAEGRLVADLTRILAGRHSYDGLRRAARQTILDRYAMKDLYPAHKAFFAEIAARV